jgi:predicted transcriptional regulator
VGKSLAESELQATFKGRQLRMKQLIDFVKSKGGKVAYIDVCRYLMKKYWLTTSTIDKYLRDLETSGLIELKSTSEITDDPWHADPKERLVVYKGEEENA